MIMEDTQKDIPLIPDELFRLCVEATFGEKDNNIRVISVLYCKKKIKLTYKIYIDIVISIYDIDAAREISSYLADDVRVNKFIDEINWDVVFNKSSYRDMNIIGTIIFKRREYKN